MERYIVGGDRNQVNIFPMCLDEMIDEDNSARVIDILVETFDLKAMKFTYSETKKVGRKPYDPKDMLKLYIYGYFNGIRSSRKLEKECKRNIEMMWLINSLKPDFKTIADFRKDNKKALIQVFKQFSMICDDLKLYGKEIVAIDGSKFRASNSRHKNFTKRKVEKIINHHEQNAKKYIKVLDHIDDNDVNEKSLSKEEVQEKIEDAQNKIKEYELKKKHIEEHGEISATDPDARHMGTSNNGTDIAHNVQTSVDHKNHLIVDIDVVSSPADQNQLYNMVEKTIAAFGLEIGKDRLNVLADKGYYAHNDLKKCIDNNIKAIVPKQKAPSKTGYEEYIKNNFKYDKEKNVYICPMGEILSCKSKEKTKEKRYHNYEACSRCTEKSRCTNLEKGRKITRDERQAVFDIIDKNHKDNKDIYKSRQMIVEHPFGTIKRTLGYTYFLTRGNESVKTESYMHCFTYNLIRVMNIIDKKELIEHLKLSISDTFLAKNRFQIFKARYLMKTLLV